MQDLLELLWSEIVFFLQTRLHLTIILQSTQGNSHTDCNAFINSNAGCGITEWSRASYGPYFDSQGGGVFAMKWDENGIAVCESICIDLISGPG